MNNKVKKEAKPKAKPVTNGSADSSPDLSTKEDLRNYLLNVKEKLHEHGSIFALAGLRYITNLPNIETLLDDENKELARDIWLRLKQAGLQIKNPPLLFRADEEEVQSA